jgi:nitrogen fixation NifU-like protein
MDLYQAQIVDLAKNPIHKGELADPTVTHSGVNVTCGDHVRLYLNVKDDKLTEAKWDGEGCAISIAAACLLTDELKGMKLEDAKALTNANMFAYLGVHELGPARVKCAVLSLETLQGALLKLDEK